MIFPYNFNFNYDQPTVIEKFRITISKPEGKTPVGRMAVDGGRPIRIFFLYWNSLGAEGTE